MLNKNKNNMSLDRTTPPPGLVPAALCKEHAAYYLSLSVTTFERAVASGLVHKPRALGGHTARWSRAQLDRDLENLPESGILPPENTGAPKPKMPPLEDVRHRK